MNTQTSISVFASLFISVSLPCAYALPKATVGFRLIVLADILERYIDAPPGSVVAVRRLQKSSTIYLMDWIQAAGETSHGAGNQSPTKIVALAVSSLKTKLPEGLRPEMANLLGVSKYQITGSGPKARWIWIVEFEIEDGGGISSGTGLHPHYLFQFDGRKTLIEHQAD